MALTGDIEDNKELIYVDDQFHTATNLRALVKGRPGNRTLGWGGEWRATVVGIDPETQSQVTVASYNQLYELKSDATKRSKQLLKFLVKILKNEAKRA